MNKNLKPILLFNAQNINEKILPNPNIDFKYDEQSMLNIDANSGIPIYLLSEIEYYSYTRKTAVARETTDDD
jgi:hypothetical protein